jgi:hypothetical protein
MRLWALVACALLLGAAAPSQATAPVAASSKPQSTPQAAPSQPDAKPDGGERLSAYERESLIEDRAANRIAESANTISRDQRLYALWQLGLSGAGVVFTGFAAFWAWRATHWARRAAESAGASAAADNAALDETRKAAIDARETADIARREFLVRNRPYVELIGPKAQPFINAEDDTLFGFRIAPKWKNEGSTPTFQMRTYNSYQLFPPGPIPEEFDFPDHGDGVLHPMYIGPRSERDAGFLIFPLDLLQRVRKREARLLWYGWTDYSDTLFKTARYRTEFCVDLQVEDDPAKGDVNCLRFAIHRKFNGVDEECYRQPKPFEGQNS